MHMNDLLLKKKYGKRTPPMKSILCKYFRSFQSRLDCENRKPFCQQRLLSLYLYFLLIYCSLKHCCCGCCLRCRFVAVVWWDGFYVIIKSVLSNQLKWIIHMPEPINRISCILIIFMFLDHQISNFMPQNRLGNLNFIKNIFFFFFQEKYVAHCDPVNLHENNIQFFFVFFVF